MCKNCQVPGDVKAVARLELGGKDGADVILGVEYVGIQRAELKPEIPAMPASDGI
jgi:hypothetical protein